MKRHQTPGQENFNDYVFKRDYGILQLCVYVSLKPLVFCDIDFSKALLPNYALGLRDIVHHHHVQATKVDGVVTAFPIIPCTHR